MKTKKTAKIRQANAAKWFHWRGCPLKRKVTTIVKTVNDIASWMTFSCMILNGPPFPWKPILLPAPGRSTRRTPDPMTEE